MIKTIAGTNEDAVAVGDRVPVSHVINRTAQEGNSVLLSDNNDDDLDLLDDVGQLLQGFQERNNSIGFAGDDVRSAFITPLLDQDDGEVAGVVVAINKLSSFGSFGTMKERTSSGGEHQRNDPLRRAKTENLSQSSSTTTSGERGASATSSNVKKRLIGCSDCDGICKGKSAAVCEVCEFGKATSTI